MKSGKFGPVFEWKILCIGQNHIFQVKIWQNFAQRKKKAGHTGDQPTTRGISQIWRFQNFPSNSGDFGEFPPPNILYMSSMGLFFVSNCQKFAPSARFQLGLTGYR